MTLADIAPVSAPLSAGSLPVLYSQPGCFQCKMTERWLNENDIDYLYIDVTEHPEHVDTVRSLGYNGTPVMEYAGTHWKGFNPDMLEKLR